MNRTNLIEVCVSVLSLSMSFLILTSAFLLIKVIHAL